jgi:hypothetical protein
VTRVAKAALGDSPAEEAAALAAVEGEFAPAPPAPRFLEMPPAPGEIPLRPRRIDRARTVMELAVAHFWQTVAVAVLTGLFGFYMFQEKFTGTASDFAGIFAWALTVDLSVDALIQMARGVRSPRAT